MCLVDNSSTSPLGIQQPAFDWGWIRASCELKSIWPHGAGGRQSFCRSSLLEALGNQECGVGSLLGQQS